MSTEHPDFLVLWNAYSSLSPGQKAELRRVADPEDLRDYPTVYRLFPGQSIHPGHLRLAFLLPWCEQAGNANSLARQWVEAKISESRLLQVARSDTPIDLIQFRRLAVQMKPKVNWAEFGAVLWYWGSKVKRELVENFYLAKFESTKGVKK